jgi:sulfhydrogenase subunit beta (sulfur reductase)
MADRMTPKVVEKKKLAALGKAIIADGYRLFGPVLQDDGIVLAEFDEEPEFDLAYKNFKMSPKEFFLPQSEVVCRFCGGEAIEGEAAPEEKRVIFGLRPCDARAIWLMDKVFLEDPVDVYYEEKRKNTVVISLACSDPEDTCFCSSVGGSPAGSEGSDILVFDLGEELVFDPVTARGEDFLGQFSKVTRDAAKKEIAEKDRIAEEGSSQMEKLSLDGIAEKLAASYDSEMWDAPSQKCLGCGTCTFFCPTCHCFDVTDETFKGEGRRVRTWDSCMYSLFTLHASGHNPRPSQKERTRQRFMHKFSYSKENHGELFCVGCGRCITHCPVNLDLREVITR